MNELEIVRRQYAEGLALAAGADLDALVDAFAKVPRERFLGPGPWQIMGRAGYRTTPDADPRHVYHDVLIALVPERRLNNGQPSFLASLMRAARLQAGQHVVHLGCGVGYYTAIMAEVVGPSGRVTAVEAEPALAARAAELLSEWTHVTVSQRDGVEADFEQADVVLVNFGMTHPLRRWLDRLAIGGRLILPITAASGVGAMLLCERTDRGFTASAISPTQIFSSVSGRDPALERKLAERFSSGQRSSAVIRSVRLDAHEEDESCWLHCPDCCLSSQPLEPSGALDAYVGAFRIGPDVELTFVIEHGALHVRSPLGEAALVERGPDQFDVPGFARVRFSRDDAGAVTAVTVETGGQSYDARRA